MDHVFAIREAATINIRKLVECFGVQWARDKVISKVLQLSEDQNYLRRMTTIFCVNELSSVLSGEQVSKLILPTLMRLSKDKVTNLLVFNTILFLTIILDSWSFCNDRLL